MQWFRWYHNTCTDPKFAGIAYCTKQRKTTVLAVWAACLESASESKERGCIAALPHEIALALSIKLETAEQIMKAFEERGMTEGGRFVSWDKRQPDSDDAAARMRRKRQEEKTPVPNSSEHVPIDVRNNTALDVDQTRLDKTRPPLGPPLGKSEPATVFDLESETALAQNYCHLNPHLPPWITGPAVTRWVVALAKALEAGEWEEQELIKRLQADKPKTSDKFPDGYLRRQCVLRDKEREKRTSGKHYSADPSTDYGEPGVTHRAKRN